MTVQEVDSKLLPPLKNDPAKTNWWEKVGGLPSLVTRIAKHLVSERGKSESEAIATAISQTRKVCESGRTFGGKVGVHAGTKAEYCKAAAEIEAKRAKAKASVKEAELSQEDAASLALSAIGKLSVLAEALGPEVVLGVIRKTDGRITEGVAGEVASEILELNAIIEVFSDVDVATMESVEESFVIPSLGKLRSQVKTNRRSDNRKSKSKTSTSTSGTKHAPAGTSAGGQFISSGATGPVVKGIQKRLGVKTTGTFEQQTKKRIETFQRKHGLQVDGVIGKQTATALLTHGKTKVSVGAITTGIRSKLKRQFG